MRTRAPTRPAPPRPTTPTAYMFPDHASVARMLASVHIGNTYLVKGSEGDWRLLALNLPIADPAALGLISWSPPASPTPDRRQPSSHRQLSLVRGGRV